MEKQSKTPEKSLDQSAETITPEKRNWGETLKNMAQATPEVLGIFIRNTPKLAWGMTKSVLGLNVIGSRREYKRAESLEESGELEEAILSTLGSRYTKFETDKDDSFKEELDNLIELTKGLDKKKDAGIRKTVAKLIQENRTKKASTKEDYFKEIENQPLDLEVATKKRKYHKDTIDSALTAAYGVSAISGIGGIVGAFALSKLRLANSAGFDYYNKEAELEKAQEKHGFTDVLRRGVGDTFKDAFGTKATIGERAKALGHIAKYSFASYLTIDNLIDLPATGIISEVPADELKLKLVDLDDKDLMGKLILTPNNESFSEEITRRINADPTKYGLQEGEKLNNLSEEKQDEVLANLIKKHSTDSLEEISLETEKLEKEIEEIPEIEEENVLEKIPETETQEEGGLDLEEQEIKLATSPEETTEVTEEMITSLENHEVVKGDNIWNIIGGMKELENLNEGQRSNAIANIIEQIKKDPTEIGLENEQSIHTLKIGQEIKLDVIQDILKEGEIGGEGIIEHAEGLSTETIEKIEANNKLISDIVKDPRFEGSLDEEMADKIIKAGSVEKYFESLDSSLPSVESTEIYEEVPKIEPLSVEEAHIKIQSELDTLVETAKEEPKEALIGIAKILREDPEQASYEIKDSEAIQDLKKEMGLEKEEDFTQALVFAQNEEGGLYDKFKKENPEGFKEYEKAMLSGDEKIINKYAGEKLTADEIYFEALDEEINKEPAVDIEKEKDIPQALVFAKAEAAGVYDSFKEKNLEGYQEYEKAMLSGDEEIINKYAGEKLTAEELAEIQEFEIKHGPLIKNEEFTKEELEPEALEFLEEEKSFGIKLESVEGIEEVPELPEEEAPKLEEEVEEAPALVEEISSKIQPETELSNKEEFHSRTTINKLLESGDTSKLEKILPKIDDIFKEHYISKKDNGDIEIIYFNIDKETNLMADRMDMTLTKDGFIKVQGASLNSKSYDLFWPTPKGYSTQIWDETLKEAFDFIRNKK